ncbi:hypothetical protein D3C87_259250 [compost metagenome]
MTRLLFLLALSSLSAVAVAADAPAARDCRNGSFATEQGDFALARVIGNARLYLLADSDGCPAKGEPACRQRSYVVAGDTLITGHAAGGYRCGFYPNAGGGSAGWVQAQRLQPLPVAAAPTLRDWTGHWSNGDDTLVLGEQDGQLVVTGEAFWPSAKPTPQRPYGPNLGQIDAIARPMGTTVHFKDSDDASCELHAQWLGDYLVVSDNSECGGLNVRFNGVYRRQAHTR